MSWLAVTNVFNIEPVTLSHLREKESEMNNGDNPNNKQCLNGLAAIQ